MSNVNFMCKEIMRPLTNDVVWKIDDISLALGGLYSLIKDFIKQYPHPDYSLSIYDNKTAKTIEIACGIDEIPQIAEYIYHLEKGTPLTFIGTNSISGSYVIGMSISKGRIEFGCYFADEGELKKM